ncbi:hypothetical protein [Rhodococcus erythropolis]|uniref:hypothetical protein n=1 Tax=Rhodococcus erythropolis TaxID=1833 RepID=UPI001BEA32D9|nr:hypothetical protein [Rhodococcus erythropolis]MBT2269680.1 hypothetical protein [Rhodococcus erythropolis]
MGKAKRRVERATSRSALVHTAVTVGCALVAMMLVLVWSAASGHECTKPHASYCLGTGRFVLAIAPTAVLLVGGVSALLRAYRMWKANGPWQVWQGVGWGLLTLMVVYLTVSGRVLLPE